MRRESAAADPVFVTIFFQPIEIRQPVVVGKKDLLSAVAPLRNDAVSPQKPFGLIWA